MREGSDLTAPVFSIATPCLASLPVLRRCVGSVRGQGDAAVQHIVQDGASADGTAAWLAGQPDLDWRSEPDSGMYAAINRGWARARGDVVSWLNADEQYLPGTLERVAAAFRAHPEADAVWGDTIVVDPSGRPIAARREIPLRAVYVRNGFLYAMSGSLFFRRRLLDAGLLHLDESFRNAADFELVLRLVAARTTFVHVPAYLSLFGVDGNNLTIAPGTRMEAECAVLRERYGAYRGSWPRKAVMACRYGERLLAGCYRRQDLAYDFATDERPTYRRVRARRVGTFFNWETFTAA